MSIEERINLFRQDLPRFDVPDLVRRHIISGESYILSNEAHFSLRNMVCEHFSISYQEVIVVGSAKLGFSIAPYKRYRHFQDNSDIDVVICSSILFDAFWQDVFDYWSRGEQWVEIGEFRKYLFRGWMRPDKLPTAKSFIRGQEWWEFFRQLTATGNFGPYKITGALYKTWHFFECYQQRCVEECKVMENGIR